MKYLAIALFIISSIFLQAQEKPYITSYPSYQQNDIVYLYGNNVYLRSKPTADSESLMVLPIGSKIIVMQNVEPNYTNQPIWIKVRFRDTVGYIRSDFISLLTTSINQTPLYTQLRTIGDQTFVLFRSPTNKDSAYTEKRFEVFNTMFYIEIFGNKGLANVDNIIHLNYISEACGVDGGGKYIFIKDNTWVDAFSYTQVADADIFYWWEELTFPEEHGQGDFILYKSEYMETLYRDDDYDNPYDKKTDTLEKKLYWDGHIIYPPFKQEPDFINY